MAPIPIEQLHTGKKRHSKKQLYEKAIKFFNKYEKELNQIRQLLDIRLSQLALAYTTEHRLPCESVSIKTRVKTIDSFLQKLEKLGHSDFNFPSNIVYDLIGARATCWFLDDCKGMADYIQKSNFLSVEPGKIYNYIENPKPSGYRAIHLHANISYDSMTSKEGVVKFTPEKVVCEIQVRTKLMDTWADLTHEFHYKAKDMGIEDPHLEKMLETQAKRFFSEDESFVAIRNMYQKMIGHTEKKEMTDTLKEAGGRTGDRPCELIPSKGMDVRSCDIATFWIEDGILYSVAKGTRRSMKNLEEFFEKIDELTGGRKMYVVADTNEMRTYSKAEKDFFISELSKICLGMAIISCKPFGRMMSTVVLLKGDLPFKVKMFDNTNEAIKWIKDLESSGGSI